MARNADDPSPLSPEFYSGIARCIRIVKEELITLRDLKAKLESIYAGRPQAKFLRKRKEARDAKAQNTGEGKA